MRLPAPLLFFGGDDHDHSLPFQARHLFNFANVDQGLGEFQQDQLSLFLIDNRPAFEEHVNLHFRPFLQEFDGMVQFEVEIVFIGIWPKPDLLNHNLRGLGLHLFLLLFKLVKKLFVVDHLANRRICRRGYLDKVKTFAFSNIQCFTDVIDPLFYVFTNDPDNRSFDPLVDIIGFLFLPGLRISSRAAKLCYYWVISYIWFILCRRV